MKAPLLYPSLPILLLSSLSPHGTYYYLMLYLQDYCFGMSLPLGTLSSSWLYPQCLGLCLTSVEMQKKCLLMYVWWDAEIVLKNFQRSTTQKLVNSLLVGSVRKWDKTFSHGMGRIHRQSKGLVKSSMILWFLLGRWDLRVLPYNPVVKGLQYCICYLLLCSKPKLSGLKQPPPHLLTIL